MLFRLKVFALRQALRSFWRVKVFVSIVVCFTDVVRATH